MAAADPARVRVTIAAGPGIVLVDTGMHLPGSMAQLEDDQDAQRTYLTV